MIYQNFTNFLKNRAIELMGLSLIFMAFLFSISFFSYSPGDPTFVYGPSSDNINNLLGVYGGIIADFLLQSFGLTSFLILITFVSWGLNLIIKKELKNLKYKIFYLFLYIIFNCLFIYTFYNNSFWLIDNGNSGFVGQIIYIKISNLIPMPQQDYIIFIFLVLAIIFFILASDFNFKSLLFGSDLNLNPFKKKNHVDDNLDFNSGQ